MDARSAKAALIAGNLLYQEEKVSKADTSTLRRAETARTGQKPFAAIVSCSDSRVPVEHIFSAGVGDLFVIRKAGNIIGVHELGSIEYAVGYLGVKLVVILGHNGCGAIVEALRDRQVKGAAAVIIEEIRAAIGSEDSPEKAEVLNTWNSWRQINRSPLVEQAVQDSGVQILAAHYDIYSGRVEFL